MPEVFTDENKHYYIYDNSKYNSNSSRFTPDEVINIRNRYVNENAKTIYEEYKDRISF